MLSLTDTNIIKKGYEIISSPNRGATSLSSTFYKSLESLLSKEYKTKYDLILINQISFLAKK